MRIPKFLPSLALPFVCAAFVPAQQRDPSQEIQEIARSIDEQLQEIDKLLLESGKKNQARNTPKEKLKTARERSESVEAGINRLIEKLEEMKQQSSSPSEDQQSRQDQQNKPQPRPQSGNQQNRRENKTPDFVKQPPEGEQGQQQGQPQNTQGQPQGAKPDTGEQLGGQEHQTGGENKPGSRLPESETAPGKRGEGSDSWGELQPYLNAIKNRGSAPKVPEKYRKYWEAYLKSKKDRGS